MTLQDSRYISVLKEKGKSINWSIVARPSYSQDRDINQSIDIRPIYSIHAKAPNPDLAWNIMKFVNGEEVAKVQYQSLSSHISYSKETNGVSLEPFYRLDIDMFAMNELLRRRKHYGSPIGTNLYKLIDQKAELVMKGTLSAKEALEQIQSEGQGMLRAAMYK